MNAAAPALRALALRRAPRESVRIAPALVGGLLDLAAAVVFLATRSHPDRAAAWTACLLHLAAAFLVAAWRTSSPARRTLAAIAVLAVPCAGAAIAAATLATRGRGTAAARDREPREPRGAAAGRRSRAGGTRLPLPDALLDGDEEEHLAAIAALLRRADGEAFALLRCVAAGHDPDRALLASLALDTLGERAERGARPHAFPPDRDVAV